MSPQQQAQYEQEKSAERAATAAAILGGAALAVGAAAVIAAPRPVYVPVCRWVWYGYYWGYRTVCD